MMPAARATTVVPAFSAEADEDFEVEDAVRLLEELEALPVVTEDELPEGAELEGELTLARAVEQPVEQPVTEKKELYA